VSKHTTHMYAMLILLVDDDDENVSQLSDQIRDSCAQLTGHLLLIK
jgi:CheY-like chemotaxis protein